MVSEVVCYLYFGKFVLIVFGDVDGDVDFFFIWCQVDLGRIDVEMGIVVIQVVVVQGFKVVCQFLFLVFMVVDYVLLWYFIVQLEVGDQFIG